MTLDFDDNDDEKLFFHSAELDQGMTRTRKGQSTYVVALDGTGDYASIQEAINDLPSTGGTIYIKEGIYNVTSSIIIDKSNVTIQGIGKGTKINRIGSFNIISASSLNNIRILDLWISGAEDINSEGIYLYGSDASEIKGCWFSGNRQMEIDMNNCTKSKCVENQFLANTLYTSVGIYLTNCKNCIVERNIFNENMTIDISAIYIGGGSGKGNIIANNNINIWPGTGVGITLENGENDNVIIGNYFGGSLDLGIDVQAGSNRTLITGNNLKNTTLGIQDNGTSTQIGHNIQFT